MSLVRLLFGLALVTAFALAMPVHAQILGTGAPTEDVAGPPPDPLGRDTPRGLVAGLVAALAEGDFDRGALYFEGADGPGIAAWRLPAIQDALNAAGELRSPGDLSLAPEGTLNDGRGPRLEEIGRIGQGERGAALLATRVEADGRELWLVSADSADLLGRWRFAGSTEPGPAERLIGTLPEGPTLGGVPVRDWGLLAFFAGAAYGLAFLMTWFRGRLARLLRGRAAEEGRFTRFVAASEPPLRLFLAAVIFSLGASSLGVSLVARYQTVWIVELAGWFAAAWFFWRLIDAMAEATLSRMSRRGAVSAYSAVMFLTRLMKVLVAGIFVAIALRALGVDITAGLAALGVGGIALAFGAQKLIENLIGSVTLIADRPVRVGDFCRFGDTLGTVEEIGIRSTKIRTLARTVVTVPNGEFSSLHLENFARRDTFWFHHVIGVRYETTPETMRGLLADLRNLLLEHPRVSPDPARVRFIRFGDHSLDIELFAYVYATEWNHYLETQEELMLAVMERVERAGSGFAFPSSTVYIGQDTGLPPPEAAERRDEPQ